MNRRLLASLPALWAISALAQQHTELPPKELPQFPYRIIQSTKIDLGDHSVFLNRVVPPPTPVQPAIAPSPIAPPLSAQVTDTLVQEESKKSELLFLFATVFDRGVTALHWSADGREYRALSNIDFNHITTLGQIETAGTVYGLMLAIGNEPIEALDAERGVLVSKLSKTRSEYVLIEDKEQVASDASLAGLDALHVYFDANRQKLIDAYAKREAARVEQEQWVRDHPPVPRDTVINYWPGPGTIMIDIPNMGGRP